MKSWEKMKRPIICYLNVQPIDLVGEEIDKELENESSSLHNPVSTPTQKRSGSNSLITLNKSELRKSKKNTTREKDRDEEFRQIQENLEHYTRFQELVQEMSHNIQRIEFLKLGRKLLARLENSTRYRSKLKKSEEVTWSSYKSITVQYPDRYIEDPKIMGTKFEGITFQEWFELVVEVFYIKLSL
jgi:hypothetical protein